MSKTRLCDLCACPIKDTRKRIRVVPKFIWHLPTINGDFEGKLDVCYDCWSWFKRFIQEGKKIQFNPVEGAFDGS